MKISMQSSDASQSANQNAEVATAQYTRFELSKTTPSLWCITFNNPPINLIDYTMMQELSDLFTQIENGNGPAVLAFDSANPEFFLAHYDITGDNEFINAQKTVTGFQPWSDILVRLTRLPAVTIAAIEGRSRMAGSEFLLACDIRFASLERAIIGQQEVGFGAIPGGGPASLLPRLVGRGRAFEILLGGEDFDGQLAERYGYVNRAIPDAEFKPFVDRFARRVSTFNRVALSDIKHFVNEASRPSDEDFPPQMDAFWKSLARPDLQVRAKKLFELGLQTQSDVELRLGDYVGQVARETAE